MSTWPVPMMVLVPVLLVALFVLLRLRARGAPVTVPMPPVDRTREGVIQLAAEGRRLEAIRLLRDLSGWDLRDSRLAVEALGRGEPLPPFEPRGAAAPALDDDALARIRALVAEGRVIDAIAVHRHATGADLVTSKRFVEGLREPR